MTHKAFKLSLLLPAAALFAAIVISGCSSSTTTTPTNNAPVNVYPAMGSSFTYTEYQTDSLGNVIIGSDVSIHASVTDSGKTFFLQPNSYTISDDNGDTIHYAYSSTNDVPTYIENSGATGLLASVGDTIFRRWITLSTASHTASVVVLDSMKIQVVVSSFTIDAKVHLIVKYIGSDSLHLGTGEALFVQHCQIIATATSDPSFLINPPVTLTNSRDIYFAPKIGTYAKETTFTTIPSAVGMPGNKSGTAKILASYTLK